MWQSIRSSIVLRALARFIKDSRVSYNNSKTGAKQGWFVSVKGKWIYVVGIKRKIGFVAR